MAKKVFISYAWEDDRFAEKVLNFSNKLRSKGIDANIDQYEENPDMGWPIWMEQQIEQSDFVLIIFTKSYWDKFNQYRQGKGVSWEISSIYQSLYELQGHNDKFIPVVFDDKDKKYIVKALQPYTNYNIITQFQKLENRIKGILNTVKPPLNEILPQKQRRTLFISSPINIDLWDKAKWKGVTYLYIPDYGWLLGLIYEGNPSSAVSIFSEWQKIENIDDYLDICFIYGDIEGLPKNGYTCLISPNISKSVQRIKSNSNEEILILAVNRFQRMYPNDNFAQFNFIRKLIGDNNQKPVPIVPVTLRDQQKGSQKDNLVPHFNEMIFTKNIRFLNSSKIKKTDLESCVIPKYNKNFPNEWNKE